jgi:hypothetical protein
MYRICPARRKRSGFAALSNRRLTVYCAVFPAVSFIGFWARSEETAAGFLRLAGPECRWRGRSHNYCLTQGPALVLPDPSLQVLAHCRGRLVGLCLEKDIPVLVQNLAIMATIASLEDGVLHAWIVAVAGWQV